MPMRAAARRVERYFLIVVFFGALVLAYQTWRAHTALDHACHSRHLLAQIDVNDSNRTVGESKTLITTGDLPLETRDILQDRITFAVKQLQLAHAADCA